MIHDIERFLKIQCKGFIVLLKVEEGPINNETVSLEIH